MTTRNDHPAGTAGWLSLMASPTFVAMALLVGLGTGLDTGPDVFCATAKGASALSGMVPMYLLMSVFHVGPWLRLIAARLTDFDEEIEERRHAR